MNNFVLSLIIKFQSERGQALAEYALILAFIAIVCVVALGLIGTALGTKLTGVSDNLV